MLLSVQKLFWEKKSNMQMKGNIKVSGLSEALLRVDLTVCIQYSCWNKMPQILGRSIFLSVRQFSTCALSILYSLSHSSPSSSKYCLYLMTDSLIFLIIWQHLLHVPSSLILLEPSLPIDITELSIKCYILASIDCTLVIYL